MEKMKFANKRYLQNKKQIKLKYSQPPTAPTAMPCHGCCCVTPADASKNR